MAKAGLREAARAVRRAIPPDQRAQKSDHLAARFLALPELIAAPVVGCYASVGSEVETGLILRGLLARGLRVGIPVVLDEGMRFVRLQHPWGVQPGPRGIPVPAQPWEELEGGQIGIVAVPGLRFGLDGSRLGQGGGHFDRFLHEHPRAIRVGLAFCEQVVDTVPSEAHDEPMDVVVTEDAVHRIGSRRPR